MGLAIDVTETGVDLTFSGLDAVLCLQRHLHVHLADVERARVATWDEVRPDLGWRVGGGYWPGWFATGHYTFKGRPGARQLWDVYKDREVLVIDTSIEHPARIVVQHPDRVRLAELIEAGRQRFTA